MAIDMAITEKAPVKQVSIADARDGFAQIIHEVEEGKRVEVTRRGRPVAVILAAAQYEQLAAGKRGFAEAARQWRETYRAEQLDIDPDEIWGDVRGRSAGREFSW
jgi:prevent-host-death family protein